MKKYPFLAAMAMTVLAGCNNNAFEEGPVVAAGETPIIVRTGVATKAVVAAGDAVTATFALISAAGAPDAAAWEAFEPRLTNTFKADGSFQTYATDAANVSTGVFTANATLAQSISFNPILYYDKVATNNSHYLVGVAPAGTVGVGGTVAFSVKDGEQDVMYAAQINKGKESEAASKNDVSFEFNHQTGQVSFVVKKAGVWKEEQLVTVNSIKLQSVQLPASIKLADGAVKYDAAKELLLPNVLTTQAVTAEGVPAGNPVMIAPTPTLLIDVTLEIKGEKKTYLNLPVTFAEAEGVGVTKGNASLVTINVKEPATSTETPITATATVVAWGTGNTGSVDLN